MRTSVTTGSGHLGGHKSTNNWALFLAIVLHFGNRLSLHPRRSQYCYYNYLHCPVKKQESCSDLDLHRWGVENSVQKTNPNSVLRKTGSFRAFISNADSTHVSTSPIVHWTSYPALPLIYGIKTSVGNIRSGKVLHSSNG